MLFLIFYGGRLSNSGFIVYLSVRNTHNSNLFSFILFIFCQHKKQAYK